MYIVVLSMINYCLRYKDNYKGISQKTIFPTILYYKFFNGFYG